MKIGDLMDILISLKFSMNLNPFIQVQVFCLHTKLPKLQPRFYSISSSPKLAKDFISITLGVSEYHPEGKSIHYGVCSKWLDELNENAQVPAFIRRAQ